MRTFFNYFAFKDAVLLGAYPRGPLPPAEAV